MLTYTETIEKATDAIAAGQIEVASSYLAAADRIRFGYEAGLIPKGDRVDVSLDFLRRIEALARIPEGMALGLPSRVEEELRSVGQAAGRLLPTERS